MKKVVDLSTVARPINLNNRKEKLEQRRQEIRARQEKLKKKTTDIIRRK
ncbi:hypothetical protein [Mesobacillus zeae]